MGVSAIAPSCWCEQELGPLAVLFAARVVEGDYLGALLLIGRPYRLRKRWAPAAPSSAGGGKRIRRH